MPETPDSKDNLSIRCPSCRQRFSVDPTLRDRMVECGGCDARFRINDEVIIRTKKFYPGERIAAGLSRFQRVPMSAAAPEGLQPARYVDVSPAAVGPVSAQRVLAGILGVGLMLVTALYLIFSVGQQGSLSAMSVGSKLVIACFVAVLGLGLLMYANPRTKKKAGFFGILMAAGLISIPFFFKGQPLSGNDPGKPVVEFNEPAFPVEEFSPEADLRKRFTTKPLEDEQERLAKLSTDQQAFGIYLTNLIPRNIYTVRDYLIRDTEAGPSSHPFPRDDGDYLMILTEVDKDFEEVALIAGKLGETTETYPEIGVIVVRVNNDQFEAGSAEKLNNPNDPAFYALNQYELDNIDLDRVERAVDRLANVEPKIFRSDISQKLVRIMTQPGVNFHDVLAKALMKWAEEPGPAGEAALEVIRKRVATGDPVPESLVELVAKEEIGEAIPLVNELWLKSPGLWESHFAKFGPPIEPLILAQINAESAPLQRSAIKLLGRVGSAESLPALRKFINSDNAEVRVLTERSIEAINAR
ncbi:MAG: hypothetical protein ABJQ29_12270 [Luteolibacter sp.]